MVALDPALGGTALTVEATLQVAMDVPPTASAAAVGDAIRAAVLAQLEAATAASRAGIRLAAVHWTPACFPVPVTAVLPCDLAHTATAPGGLDAADKGLTEHRRELHGLLGQDPPDRPLFRLAQALPAASAALGSGARLRCPHATLRTPSVKGGLVALVAGEYDYYHYMQDRFDDNGWGCAYRSFQTIVSWCVPVPLHRRARRSKPYSNAHRPIQVCAAGLPAAGRAGAS